MSTSRYYTDRVHATAAGIAATIGVAVVASLVGGVVIGFVDYYDPFRVFAFFAVVGGASLIGYAIGATARAVRLHHPTLRSAIGVTAGLLTAYALWVACTEADMARASQGESTTALFAASALPSNILQAMYILAADEGTLRWQIGGFPTGVVRHVFYGLEIAIIVFCVWTAARERDLPFCHESGDWADELEDVALLARPDDANDFRIGLERGQYDSLRRLRREGIDEANCYRVTLYVDPAQGEENYLDVRHVDEDAGRETEVVRLLRVPRTVVASLTEPVTDHSQRMPIPPTDGRDDPPRAGSPNSNDSTVHEPV